MSNWDNMQQWEVVLPPSRPTIIELKRIQSYIMSSNRMFPVAVLGSTPEFRELLGRMGFNNVYIFDRSTEFNSLMTELIPDKSILHEKLIVGDWLDTIKKFENKFQFILSDLTMGNISYSNRSLFYSSIRNSLTKEGVFIDKALVFDFSTPSLKTLFEKYECLPVNLRTINDFSSEVLFCSELVEHSSTVDSTIFYEFIRQGDFTRKIKHFADKAHMITPEGFVWYYGVPWENLKEEYYKGYSQVLVYPEEDIDSPYYHRTKQFFCKK